MLTLAILINWALKVRAHKSTPFWDDENCCLFCWCNDLFKKKNFLKTRLLQQRYLPNSTSSKKIQLAIHQNMHVFSINVRLKFAQQFSWYKKKLIITISHLRRYSRLKFFDDTHLGISWMLITPWLIWIFQ